MSPTRHPDTLPAILVDVAPAYEFLMTMAAVSQVEDAETYDIGTAWLSSAEERAGAELVRRVREFSSRSCDLWINLVALAYDAPAPRDVPTFIAHARRTDALEIRLHVVGYYSKDARRMTPPDVMRRAASGDADAIAEFLRTSYPEYEPWQEFLRHQLSGDLEAAKAEMIELLEAWKAAVWDAEEGRIMPILTRDADDKRALARHMPFERFIETATNGVEWLPQSGITRVVLVPTFVYRPWVSNTELADAMILVYPVSDESVTAETDAPPLRLVRLSKALGDEKRLRILRTLAEGERGLMELAELFSVPKTTMHHHMIQLRAAGLVTVTAGTKRYRLRHETLPDVGALLHGYLGTATPPPEAAPTPTTRPAARPAPRRTRPDTPVEA